MSDRKQAPQTQQAITELKVSGHLMALDAGVFCVFNQPGSAPPDGATGLPGVRITTAPSANGYPGHVSVVGFGADGWVGGSADAALIRVTGGPAQVLVTVYQAADTAHEAPKLQFIRLTEPPAQAPAPKPAPQQAAISATPPAIEVAAHIAGQGDLVGRLGDWMGEPGSKRQVEGFGIAPTEESGITASDLEYQAVLGRGWLSPWAEGGQFCGSRGMSLPILGLRVRLKGDAAQTHVARVSATFVDGAKAGPVTDGSSCEAPSLAALEAFRVEIMPAGGAKPAGKPMTKAAPAKGKAAPAAAAPKTPAKPAKRTPATTRRR